MEGWEKREDENLYLYVAGWLGIVGVVSLIISGGEYSYHTFVSGKQPPMQMIYGFLIFGTVVSFLSLVFYIKSKK